MVWIEVDKIIGRIENDVVLGFVNIIIFVYEGGFVFLGNME